MRAVRKNGEVLGGRYIVGGKWAVSLAVYSHSHQCSARRLNTTHNQYGC